METVIYFMLAEQMIANVALAAVIVVFGRSIMRLLQANIEPSVHAEILGDLDHCALVISNHSACEIANLRIEISEASPLDRDDVPGRVIFSDTWPVIAAGGSVTADNPPIAVDRLSLDTLSGTCNEVVVKWSFVRRADGRPFSSAYRLELMEQSDGKVNFVVPNKPRGSLTRRADSPQSPLTLTVAAPGGGSTAALLSASGNSNFSAAECIG